MEVVCNEESILVIIIESKAEMTNLQGKNTNEQHSG